MADNCPYWSQGRCNPPGALGSGCSWPTSNYMNCAVYKMVVVEQAGGSLQDQLQAADCIPSGTHVSGGRGRVLSDVEIKQALSISRKEKQSAETKDLPFKCRRCGRSQTQINSEYYCFKCDKAYWWNGRVTYLIIAIASIMIGALQCNPGFWRWLWIVIGALLICMFISEFWQFYRGNLLHATNSRTDSQKKQKQNAALCASGEIESYTAVSTPQNSQSVDQVDYLIDYENGSIPIGDLPIGARVADLSWVWEFRSGSDYTHKEGDEKKPVVWIIVAKNHYSDLGPHVTLLSEELIGRLSFDNSINRSNKWAKYGHNHWGESGTGNASLGLRPWLNSTGIHAGEGFFQAFSESFKNAVLTTTVPNKEWENGSTYITSDKVYIPSLTELGDIDNHNTYQIGSAYPYFKVAYTAANRIAFLGAKANRNCMYWTRSPASNIGDAVRTVNNTYGFLNHVLDAVRPALNLKSGILVSEIKK